ncbi:MAG: hypothetical protein M3542_10250 [Acidobacteriota bacterium]|nr:hypothetical protein [Acidobacteriota bacterium]MDQ5871661.1 hypothetical protein [Acidobacteriota bacterium]
MRLPVRAIAITVGILTAVAGAAQTKPEREIPGSTVVVTPPTQTITVREAVVSTTESGPQPLGFESDLHCFGYLGETDEKFVAQVVSAESVAEQIDYMTSDLLYVDGGHDRGLKIGDEFWLVTPEMPVLHPRTGKDIGRFHQYRGRAVVETLEGRTAALRVTSSCTDVPMGAFLKPFEAIPIPLARKTPPATAGDPPSGKAQGQIVFTRDGIVAVGADHTVIVDLGVANGVEPGDFLTIYRYSKGREEVRPIGGYWVSVAPVSRGEIPRTYLGEIGILAVGDRWAIGRVTDSYRLIEVGDEVELK